VTAGEPRDIGGIHEAIADPWLARGGGYNFLGSVYLNELALDLALQLQVAGVAPTPGFVGCMPPPPPPPPTVITLDAGAGMTWELFADGGNATFALGRPLLNGRALDSLPVGDGIAFWRRASDYAVVDVFATALERAADGASAVLRGGAALPDGTRTSVNVTVTLARGAPAATLAVAFSATADVAPGWQLCVKWASDGDAADEWRATAYPKVANASSAAVEGLAYMGWPGFWLFRPNASLVAFFSLATSEPFSNPTDWTGATSFWFQSAPRGGGHQVAPQFALGGSGFAGGRVYAATLRLLASDAGETLAAVRAIAPALLALDGYAVAPLAPVRAPADMLACFFNARRVTPMWRTTCDGSAYQLQDAKWYPDIYVSSTPMSALVDYNAFIATGDAFWRNRTMAQMAFWMRSVAALPPGSRHAGVLHTAYDIPSCTFNSVDRGNNRGFKVDLNAHSARYALLAYEAVLVHEGLNMSAWLAVARAEAEWVLAMGAAQPGAGGVPGAGGFPQKIDAATDVPTPSVASGRLANALPVFARVLGDSAAANYTALAAANAAWLARGIEADLFFTGAHPDLVWANADGDAVWNLVEHWLARWAATRDPAALDRAVGDAYFALLNACPVDLPFVTHPTQFARDEQAGVSGGREVYPQGGRPRALTPAPARPPAPFPSTRNTQSITTTRKSGRPCARSCVFTRAWRPRRARALGRAKHPNRARPPPPLYIPTGRGDGRRALDGARRPPLRTERLHAGRRRPQRDAERLRRFFRGHRGPVGRARRRAGLYGHRLPK